MKWRQERYSDNVEDRRRISPAAVGGIGGLGLIVVLAIAVLTGQDPSSLIEQLAPAGGDSSATQGLSPEDEQAGAFVSQVLADTETTWQGLFSSQVGDDYNEPRLVMFTGRVESACGYASAAVGPFYCPIDGVVYLDTAFFDELSSRFGATGDFAVAYVIAHEIGHHVQAELGLLQQTDAARRRVGQAQGNQISVGVELMADCLAGVWANHAQQANLILDEQDIEEGLGAASAVGDDRLQMQQQGYVVPDAFTHGTSKQRMQWFMRGLQVGTIEGCNTFEGS